MGTFLRGGRLQRASRMVQACLVLWMRTMMVVLIAEVSRRLGRSGHDAEEMLISPALLMVRMSSPCLFHDL